MSNDRTVFFILTKDPTKVQGNTEKYYLSRFFAEQCALHVFAPLRSSIPKATNHALPVKGIIGAFLLNVLFLPYWCCQFITYRPDIVYCYQNVILPPLIGKYVFGATVAFDIRSAPYDQSQEFFEADERSVIFRITMFVAKFFHKITLKRADHVFVVSCLLADSIKEKYNVGRDSIKILPLGVDTKKFKPCNKSNERVRIVYIGSLTKYRGLDTFFAAVEQFPKETKQNLRIDLYGDGLEDYISELVANANRDNPLDTHWHGLVSHEELPRRAAKSDIAISPIPPFEAYQVSSPAKVFEYLSMGLPVVASRIKPHKRILKEGENSLLYDADSIEDFKEKLLVIIDDEKLRTQLSKNAREDSLNYDWKKRFSVVVDVLGLNRRL